MTALSHPERTRRAKPSFTSLGLALRRSTPLLLGVFPAAVLVLVLVTSTRISFAFDFHQFWQAGRDVVDGRSPYPEPGSLARVSHPERLDPQQIQDVFRFPYPAPGAVALAPLGALPFSVAAWFMTALLIASFPLSLLLLGVRDWRCYGAVFLWVPVLGSIIIGTLTPLLVLLVAAAWRWRDRRWRAATLVAAAAVLKLFLWPMVIWLAVTGRVRTALAATGVAVASTLGAWAVIGFAGLGEYPELVRTLSAAVQGKGYSLVALGLAMGFSADAARVAATALGLAALAAAGVIGRRPEGGDLGAFALALGAALALTPIVWLHYLALLLVPLAIARPRLSPLWFLPLVLWVTPSPEGDETVWRIALAGAVALAMLAASAMQSRFAARYRTA